MAENKQVELLTVEDKWEIPYAYSAGETISKFLIELRDNARILGTKCPKCNQIYLPPRSFCAKCFISIKDQWVEIDPVGELVTYSLCTERITNAPEPPYVVGFVRLGQATTTMAQYIRGIDLSKPENVPHILKSGMPVRAVFKDRSERKGTILDFYIELVK
jgi:uncharacterized OB-fold protein